MARRVFLMTDYSSSSVWDAETGAMLPPELLPLSESTARRLEAWSARLYDFLEQDDVSGEEYAEHEEEGRSLWQRVRAELGRDWRVGYAVFEPDPEDDLGAIRRIIWD